jgi:predicted peroxiredoxin
MATNGRVIVGCTHGEEDPDRVLVAYLTAGAALDQGKDVVMWLTAEGVRLALNGYGERIRAETLAGPRQQAGSRSSGD